MNSVKILHAVRSAITAIAELLVYVMNYKDTGLFRGRMEVVHAAERLISAVTEPV